PNVGAMNKYLTSMITNPVYNRVRREVKDLIHRVPSSFGEAMEHFAYKVDESVKNIFMPGMLFQELGFRYVGPIEGHDLDALVERLGAVKNMRGPILVHVLTQKGKGFEPAEEDPFKWHAAKPFDKDSGNATKTGGGGLPRYQKVFGKGLVELGEMDPRVVAITAGMRDGTSTDLFEKAHPERFFDVGIAEGHAVTFAAGLATEGIRPVVAIYSTFLQRGYDGVVHDVALQGLPVVFGMDRAGVAGADGPTHHGTFDINYMLTVPGMAVTAPKDGSEMLALLRLGVNQNAGPFSIRWPRDSVPEPVPHISEIPEVPFGSWEILRRGREVAILAVGTMVLEAQKAAEALAADSIDATVVNCRFMKPYDLETLKEVLASHAYLLTVEEGAVVNGFGAYMAREIKEMVEGAGVRMRTLGIPDEFVAHGGRDVLLREIDLDAKGIEKWVREMMGVPPGSRASSPPEPSTEAVS
ncbi:MAG: 1-deoxy-D-xylulose-5-phosphate synthase, partial [Gemmatimonadetes bacterium]|nr:1-deoxy-D-xylulose-5-phosphate synthase [Gemmatimonadota bacterium]